MGLAVTKRTALPSLDECAAARAGTAVPILDLSPVGQLALDLTAPAGPNLSYEDQIEAERRYRIIEPLIDRGKFPLLWLEHTRTGAIIKLLSQQHATKPRTIYAWLRAYAIGGIAGLVKKDRCDKGQPKILGGSALDFLLAAALPRKGSYGKLSVREIFRAYEEERHWRGANANTVMGELEIHKYGRYVDESEKLLATAQLPKVSYETLRRWYQRIPEICRVMSREGDERFSNTQEVISFRDLASILPMDYVVMDHRRLDIFCLVKAGAGWKLVRPWLTAALDMRTRRWLSWAIVETPSSDSVASVIKRCIVDFGAPTSLYFDNGKDFRCEWFEGRHLTSRSEPHLGEMRDGFRGVLETLNIRVHHAIVKRARAKLIEPNFNSVANFDRSLPWWCGHTPSDRPANFAALVIQHERWVKGEAKETPFSPIENIAALYDEFLPSLNEREHTGEGMQKLTATGRGWMCPNECWERNIGQVQRRTVSDETLRFCFWKRRLLTVKHGEVRATFGGRPFHYRLTDSPLHLMTLNGFEIELAFDPFDLGSAAVYYQNRFVGLAHNAELRRMGEDGFVQDEKDRRGARREVKKFIESVHRTVPGPDYQERSNRRRAVMPQRVEPQRAEIPVALPAAIVAAAQAAADEKKFSFAASDGAEVIREAERFAYRPDDLDDNTDFKFFEDK
jgi:hypothetical protein